MITVSSPGSGKVLAECVLKENCVWDYRNNLEDLNIIVGFIIEAFEDDE